MPEGTSLIVSVLGSDGDTLLDTVTSGADLSGVAAEAIRFKATLRTTDPYKTPVLWQWGGRAPKAPETLRERQGGPQRGRDGRQGDETRRN